MVLRFVGRSARPCRSTLRHTALVTLASLAGTTPIVAQATDDLLPLTASEAAQRHFRAGVEDQQNVYPRGAARHYEAALEADPGFGLAKVFHALQAPGLAGADRQAGIDEGLGMMSGASSAELLLAAAVKDIQAGSGAAGSRVLAQLSTLYPDDPYLATWAAQFRNARGDQTDAAAAMQDLNTRFPDYAPPYNTLAYTLWPRGNRVGAMRAVRKYVELAGDHPNPHDSYAELLQWEGQYNEALRHYQRAAELEPDYDQAYVGAAEVHWLLGDHESAVEHLEMAVQHAITPGAGVAYRRGIANVYLMRGDLDEGMEHLQAAADYGEAQSQANAAAFAYEQMAVADAMLGDGDSVEAHLARAAEVRGGTPPVHQAMAAMAHAKAGNLERARALTGELMESNPTGFFQNFGHTLMALADMGEENWEGAMGHLAAADPANPVTQAALAVCYEETGQEAEAEAQWAEVENRQINLANAFLAAAMMEKER